MSSMMENAYITGYRGFPIGGGEGDRCNRAVYKNELWERECSHSVCGKWFQSGHTPSPHVFVTNRLLRSNGNGSTFSLKRRRKKKGRGATKCTGMCQRFSFFLSFFLSSFFFRSPVVLGQECKVPYRSIAFKQVFEGLEGLSLSVRETNSRRTGENVRNPHSFGGIARFSVNIPSERSLSFVEAKILGKLQVFECVSLSLSLSLFVSFEMWRIFGACLVATGQRKRAC